MKSGGFIIFGMFGPAHCTKSGHTSTQATQESGELCDPGPYNFKTGSFYLILLDHLLRR
jgi:hypothetical protein